MFTLSFIFWALYSSVDGLVGFQSHFLPFYLGLSGILKGHEKSSHEAVTWLQPDMEACSISYSFWGICLISSSIWNQTQKACMK